MYDKYYTKIYIHVAVSYCIKLLLPDVYWEPNLKAACLAIGLGFQICWNKNLENLSPSCIFRMTHIQTEASYQDYCTMHAHIYKIGKWMGNIAPHSSRSLNIWLALHCTLCNFPLRIWVKVFLVDTYLVPSQVWSSGIFDICHSICYSLHG